ncbi:hypothetical protein ABZ468_10890 [Streptomyces sp. NPDC005708]|uniref:hypothetical protein n=1 Tax=unclassified Streptomyces TaxID=2593676 RepID=UPI0033C7A8A4
MTHTYVRTVRHRRSDLDRVSGERLSRIAANPQDGDRPTDTQIWNWAESVTLLGYGPAASTFL